VVTQLASDTFTGTNGDAWGATWAAGELSTGASALIQSNVGRITTASAGGYSGASTRKVNLSNPTDQVWLMKFRWPTGDECYPGIWMRAGNDVLDAQSGYCFELNRPGNNWKVFKTTSYTATDLATASFTFTSNTWYWVRCGVVGSDLKLKIWADGAAEPSAWTWEGTDSTYAGAGRCGIRVGPGNTGSAKFEIDDFALDDAFALAFSATATLTGSGSLTASGAPKPTASPAVAGSGALTTTRTPAFAVAAAMAGAGSLTTTRTPAIAGTATVTGSGALTAAGTPAVIQAAAALAGSGVLTLDPAPSFTRPAALAGAGALTVQAGPAPSDTMDRAATGTLAATGTPGAVQAAALAGVGALAATGTPAVPGAAAPAGAGVLAVASIPQLVGTATVAGSGALTASGAPAPSATAVLGGSGSLVMSGASIGFSGTVALAGSGSLATTRVPAIAATAGPAGSGALAARGVPKPTGTATLSGSGALLAVGTPRIPGVALLSGAGALSATVVPTPKVTVGLGGTGTLTLDRTPAVPGAATLAGAGGLTVALSGQRGARGTARLGVTARRIRLGPDEGGSSARATTAVLDGSGALLSLGVPGWGGEAMLAGAGALTAPNPAPGMFGASGLAGGGALAAAGVPGFLAGSALAGVGALAAAGTPAAPGTAARSGVGVLAAVGTPSVPIAFRASATGTNGAGTGTSITVTIPAGVQVGDGMLIVHTTRSATGATDTMTTPTGWTLVDTQAKNNTQSVLYKRVVQGGDAGTLVTLAGSATTGRVAVLVAYSGVHSTIIDAETSALDQVSGTVHSMPALAATSLADWSVEFCSDRGGPASTGFTISGSAYTSRETIVGGGSSSVTGSVADTNGVIASLSLGGETWTGTSTNANTIMYVVALKAASA